MIELNKKYFGVFGQFVFIFSGWFVNSAGVVYILFFYDWIIIK